MNNKKTLFVSLNENLYNITKSRFTRFNINKTKIDNVDLEKLSKIYFDTYDLIIVDSNLLNRKVNNKTLIDVLNDNKKTHEIFLLDSDFNNAVPKEIHFSCVFSEPVLPEQLWKMMDKVLNKD
ncbi:MAG: hypothetical protein K8S87_07470 [Planctomycetes bacterium]|nr:hypothetical protein [Planctomycetota bacterium]